MALQTSPAFTALVQLLKWAKTSLQHAVCRVNTLRISPEEALEEARLALAREASRRGRPTPTAQLHPLIRDAMIISAWPDVKPLLEPPPDRPEYPVVIVDSSCANGVLGGAPVFNGGVLAISENASVGDTVSVYVFRDGVRKWISYGKLCSLPMTPMERAEKEKLSGAERSSYLVVDITEGMSVLPPIPHEMTKDGLLITQSLPSILASHILNPQPGERVLDMNCGSGIKATHIAALTCNKADIVAVHDGPSIFRSLITRCKLTGAKVTPVLASAENFQKKETAKFDCMLIEPDHSSFASRPYIEELTFKGRGINCNIRPFAEIAASLLKPGGRLVYCTPTPIPIENDAVVRWLLDSCNVKLKAAEPRLVPVCEQFPIPMPSWMKLSAEEEKLVQRFGAHTAHFELDPVILDAPTFFIACFTKPN